MLTLLDALDKLFGNMKIKAWIEVLRLIYIEIKSNGYTYFSRILERREYTGYKGSLKRIIVRLEKAGFIKCLRENKDIRIVPTQLFYKLVEDPPQYISSNGLKIFLAGHDTAIKAGYYYYRNTNTRLNWLVSAGEYWTGKKFRVGKDLILLKKFANEIFIDSGAQQFRGKFRRMEYPYDASEYINFALKVNAQWISTLDIPLDILATRGISVNHALEKTVELGVNVIDFAERRGILDRLVPVLQGYDNANQWLECLDMYKEHGITPQKFHYWGIGSLCITRNIKLIRNVVKTLRNVLGNDVKLHVFGINLKVLRKIFPYINSYDTSTWVYWAKIDGAVLIWDSNKKRFVHLKSRRNYQYKTLDLMYLNLAYGILKMHNDLLCGLNNR